MLNFNRLLGYLQTGRDANGTPTTNIEELPSNSHSISTTDEISHRTLQTDGIGIGIGNEGAMLFNNNNSKQFLTKTHFETNCDSASTTHINTVETNTTKTINAQITSNSVHDQGQQRVVDQQLFQLYQQYQQNLNALPSISLESSSLPSHSQFNSNSSSLSQDMKETQIHQLISPTDPQQNLSTLSPSNTPKRPTPSSSPIPTITAPLSTSTSPVSTATSTSMPTTSSTSPVKITTTEPSTSTSATNSTLTSHDSSHKQSSAFLPTPNNHSHDHHHHHTLNHNHSTVASEELPSGSLGIPVQLSSKISKTLQSLEHMQIKATDVPQSIRELSKKIATSVLPLTSEKASLAGNTQSLQTLSNSNVDEDTSSQYRERELPEKTPLMTLKYYMDSVQCNVAEGEYERAVSDFQTYYKEHFCKIEEVDDLFVELLESVENKLKNCITSKNQIAISQHNLNDVERFCALYPGLGMKEQGFKLYQMEFFVPMIEREAKRIQHCLETFHKEYTMEQATKTIELSTNSIVTDESDPESMHKILPLDTESKENMQDDTTLDFVSAIRNFFEFVAQIIEGKKADIERLFGTDRMQTCMEAVVGLCDTHSSQMLQQFMHTYHLQDLVMKVNAIKIADIEGNEYLTERVDPRELTDLLEQTSLISQYNQLLDKFLQKKMVIDANAVPKLQRLRFIKEIMTYYNILEEYFMLESNKKAIGMDKVIDAPAEKKMSSVVDSIFYVLKQSSQRALSTCNVNTACSIINMLANIINMDYNQVMAQLLSDAFEGRNLTLTPLIALNNVDISIEFITKLTTDLDSNSGKIYAESLNDLDKIQTCLLELKHTPKLFRDSLLLKYLDKVASRLHARITLTFEMEGFEDCTYNLDEEKFVANEVNDPFVGQFILSFSNLLQPYKGALTENNYGDLVLILVEFIAVQLEKRLEHKKFSLLGGVQFDKELKILLQFFQTDTKRNVRSKLSRLVQISTLLNLAQVSDIEEVVGSNSPIKWKLSSTEMKAALLKRIDFAEEDIDKYFKAPNDNNLQL